MTRSAYAVFSKLFIHFVKICGWEPYNARLDSAGDSRVSEGVIVEFGDIPGHAHHCREVSSGRPSRGDKSSWIQMVSFRIRSQKTYRGLYIPKAGRENRLAAQTIIETGDSKPPIQSV